MEILPLSKEFVKNNYKELNDKFNIFFPGYDVRKVAQSIVFYVINYNDKFVGMFNIFLHSRIQKFFIMPQFHSKGIGSIVIKKIIENNIPDLHCYVKKNNKSAIKFWEKNGFKKSDDLGSIIKMNYSKNLS